MWIGTEKAIGTEATQQKIHVAQRERSARAVARGPRIRSSALGSDPQFTVACVADGSSSRRHGFDGQRWSLELNGAHPVLEAILKVALVTSYVCASSAHVEGQDVV